MHIIVLMTCSNREEGEVIVKKLLDAKQIACANIVPQVHSFYWWEGKINSDEEVLVVMKTREDIFSAVQETVKSLHSYTVPEIITLPLVAGNADYLDWIDESTREATHE